MLQLRAQTRGVEDAIRALDELARRTGTLMRTTAADLCSAIVMEEVEARVPVLTGLLSRSEEAEVALNPDGVRIFIGPREGMAVPGYGDPAVYGEIIEEEGSPAGRGKAFHKRAARAAIPRIIAALTELTRDQYHGCDRLPKILRS